MIAASGSGRIFRAGVPEDAPAIRSLFLQANLSAPSAGDLELMPSSLIGKVQTFVCQQDSELVGVLQWRSLGEEAEILDLAVASTCRRRGHAAFLLENFVQYLRQSAVQKAFLEVRESNAAAIALYNKFGFRIFGRRPDYYRNPVENALLMNLSF